MDCIKQRDGRAEGGWGGGEGWGYREGEREGELGGQPSTLKGTSSGDATRRVASVGRIFLLFFFFREEPSFEILMTRDRVGELSIKSGSLGDYDGCEKHGTRHCIYTKAAEARSAV